MQLREPAQAQAPEPATAQLRRLQAQRQALARVRVPARAVRQTTQALASGAPVRAGSIRIEGRRIGVRGRGHGAAWFDFAELCEGPRSTDDYIEIAREFQIVLLGGIPGFDANNEDAARRFVNLVDEFYDRQVTLVCTAAAPPVALYEGKRLAGAFERTASRLIEMQSAEYLARTHRG